MPHHVTSRYRATYRAEEINLIIRLALRGESLGFVGIAGIGKSNIVNFLRDLPHHAPQVQQDVTRLRFAIVDAAEWTETPQSLGKLMLNALHQATRDLSSPSEENKVISISEEERIFNGLQARLEQVCQKLNYQVMFVLDDFDRVLQTGPLALLERLNVLRSEGQRDYLSYLVFTRRLPHILGRSYDLENQSKFYHLFRHHIYALEPYNRADALRMLKHLNELAGNPLPESQLQQIYQLAGGHPQLLRTVFNSWVEEGASGVKVMHFANKPEIQQECHRILLSLHEPEQEAACLAARGQHTAEHQALLDHLARRGLLVKQNPITWFSPLMEQFLKGYQM